MRNLFDERVVIFPRGNTKSLLTIEKQIAETYREADTHEEYPRHCQAVMDMLAGVTGKGNRADGDSSWKNVRISLSGSVTVTHFPVYDNLHEDIVGWVTARSVHPSPWNDRDKPFVDLIMRKTRAHEDARE